MGRFLMSILNTLPNGTSLRWVQRASKRLIKVVRFLGFKVLRAMQRANKRLINIRF